MTASLLGYISKTNHIDIKYHFVREKVADSTIQLKYCPTNEMLADMLTKGITHEKFARLCNRCGVKDMSACKREILESPLLSDELVHLLTVHRIVIIIPVYFV